MQLTIRKAVLEDIDAIVDIHRRSWVAAYSGLIPGEYISAKNAGRFAMWERIFSEPNYTIWRSFKGSLWAFLRCFLPAVIWMWKVVER